MDLQEAIDHFNFRSKISVCISTDECKRNREIAKLLQELQSRRETEIKPTIFAQTNSIRTQIEHLASELAEVRMALVDYEAGGSIEALADELEDMKISATTAQKILGYDAKDRQEIYRRVVAKNYERKYYGKD